VSLFGVMWIVAGAGQLYVYPPTKRKTRRTKQP